MFSVDCPLNVMLYEEFESAPSAASFSLSNFDASSIIRLIQNERALTSRS